MYNKLTNQELHVVVSQYSEGFSVEEIAKELVRRFKNNGFAATRSLVKAQIWRMRLNKFDKANNFDKANKFFYGDTTLPPKEDIEAMQQLQKQGKSYVKISEALQNKYAPITICRILSLLVTATEDLSLFVSTNSSMSKSLNVLDADDTTIAAAAETLDKQTLLDTINKLNKKVIEIELNKTKIIETIKQAITSIKPTAIPVIHIDKKLKEEVAMLDISDVHIGEKVTAEESCGHELYNFNIFQERLDILCEGIIKCITVQRKGANINNLHINMLGDICTGELIFRGQQRQIDLPLHDQIFKGADCIARRLIMPLCKEFKNVTIRMVSGNHTRLSKPGDYAFNSGSDYFLYRTMELILKDQKNCNFIISESPAMIFEIPEMPDIRHLITHGHQCKAWNAIPFYSLSRMSMRYVDVMGFPIHYFHVGHFHSSSQLSNANGETLINGAFFSTNEFSMNVLNMKSQPKQRLYGLTHRGIIWTRDIQLTEVKKLKLNKYKTYTPIHKNI